MIGHPEGLEYLAVVPEEYARPIRRRRLTQIALTAVLLCVLALLLHRAVSVIGTLIFLAFWFLYVLTSYKERLWYAIDKQGICIIAGPKATRIGRGDMPIYLLKLKGDRIRDVAADDLHGGPSVRVMTERHPEGRHMPVAAEDVEKVIARLAARKSQDV